MSEQQTVFLINRLVQPTPDEVAYAPVMIVTGGVEVAQDVVRRGDELWGAGTHALVEIPSCDVVPGTVDMHFRAVIADRSGAVQEESSGVEPFWDLGMAPRVDVALDPRQEGRELFVTGFGDSAEAVEAAVASQLADTVDNFEALVAAAEAASAG